MSGMAKFLDGKKMGVFGLEPSILDVCLRKNVADKRTGFSH